MNAVLICRRTAGRSHDATLSTAISVLLLSSVARGVDELIDPLRIEA